MVIFNCYVSSPEGNQILQPTSICICLKLGNHMSQNDPTWFNMIQHANLLGQVVISHPEPSVISGGSRCQEVGSISATAHHCTRNGAGWCWGEKLGPHGIPNMWEKAQKVLVLYVFWELHCCKTFEYLWSARRFGREGLVRLDVGRFLLLLQRWWRWRRWRWRLWQEASYEDRQRPAATSPQGLTLSNGLCCSCQSAPLHLMMQRVTSSRYTADCVAELLRVCVLEVCAEQLQCSAQNCVNSSSSCAAVLCRSRTGRSKLYQIRVWKTMKTPRKRGIYIYICIRIERLIIDR